MLPDGPPTALLELLSDWQGAGRPKQAGIRWPRRFWAADFPEYADLFLALPDQLDRGVVRGICRDAASTPRAAERSLLTVMAWGYGRVGYGRDRAAQALRTPDARDRICGAIGSLREEGPVAAYRRLASRDGGLNKVGPTFATKLIYFCQAEEQSPRAVVLDRLIAEWFDRETGVALKPAGWSVRNYSSYLAAMNRWASELKTEPAELEFCIFRKMARKHGSQWGVE